MTDDTDAYVKIGMGMFLGALMVVLFGEYLWPVLAAIMGVAGIGVAVYLIGDALMDLKESGN